MADGSLNSRIPANTDHPAAPGHAAPVLEKTEAPGEAPVTARVNEPVPLPDITPPKTRRNRLRPVLFAALPLALVVGG